MKDKKWVDVLISDSGAVAESLEQRAMKVMLEQLTDDNGTVDAHKLAKYLIALENQVYNNELL